jgi:serine/threonine protein kinase
MGAAGSKPAAARLGLRKRQHARDQAAGAALAPAAAAATSAAATASATDANDEALAESLARALDAALAQHPRLHQNRAQRQRYSAQRARELERRQAALDAASEVPLEARAVACAALGLFTSNDGATATLPQLPARSYWTGPPVPPDDAARLEAMDAYGLLADAVLPDEDEDAPAPVVLRPAIQSALELVRGVFGADEALVALFGDRRVFIRDSTGLFKTGDFPWRYSFCYWTLAPPQPTALVVADVNKDARFSANSVARRAGVSFYCGLPLVAPDGSRLGVLCFASRAPRPDFDCASLAVATNLAALVARELWREAKAAIARRVSAAARLRLLDMREASAPVLMVERVEQEEEGGGARWVVRHANGAWLDLVARARRLQSVRGAGQHEGEDGPAAAAEGKQDNEGGGGGDPFGGALDADLWADIFEPPAPSPPLPPATFAPTAPLVDSAMSLMMGQAGPLLVKAGAAAAALPPPAPAPPPPLPREELERRMFAAQALFSVSGVRLRRVPFEKQQRRSTPQPPPPPVDTMARVTLRFVPAAAPGAVSAAPGIPLTAAPASLPDTPPDEAQRHRLASLWFVDVEPEPLLPLELAAGSALAGARSASVPLLSSSATAPLLVPSLLGPGAAGPAPSSPPSSTSAASSAPLLPPSLAGVRLGAPLAAGSYGRVFRGELAGHGRVAVKVVDAADAALRDEQTGAALEAVLGASLAPHPNVLRTIAWGVVEQGSAGALPPRARVVTRRRRRRRSSGVGRPSTEWSGGGGGGGGGGAAGSGGGGSVVSSAAGAGPPSSLLPQPPSQAEPPSSARQDSGNSNTTAAANPFAEQASKQLFLHGQALDGGDDDDEEEDDEAEEEQQQQQEGSEERQGGPYHLLARGNSSGNSSGSGGDGAVAGSPPTTAGAPPPPPPKPRGSADESTDRPYPAPARRPQSWLVLEFCDQGSLQEAIDDGRLRTSRDPRSGQPDLPAIVACAAEIAAGMAHLHSAPEGGVVHGDLSAYNVLLSSPSSSDSSDSASSSAVAASGGGGGDAAALGGRGYTCKIADLGLARRAASDGDNKNSESCGGGSGSDGANPPPLLHGTVTHAAPEVLSGATPPTRASDVWAFGVLLWSMWVGARPWSGMTHGEIVAAVARDGKALVWPDDAPEGLAALGEACLARDPADRPTFAEVLEILQPQVQVMREQRRERARAWAGEEVLPGVAPAVAGG